MTFKTEEPAGHLLTILQPDLEEAILVNRGDLIAPTESSLGLSDNFQFSGGSSPTDNSSRTSSLSRSNPSSPKSNTSRRDETSIKRLRNSLDGNNDTLSPARPARSHSVGASPMSLKSFEEYGEEWDHEVLLEMTDTVRMAIMRGDDIPSSDMEVLEQILAFLLIDEKIPEKAVDLEMISYTRLDKLLKDLFDIKVESQSVHLKDILAKATTLDHKWTQRFKSEYLTLDSDRVRRMSKCKALKDMVLNEAYTCSSNLWIVLHNHTIAETEGDLGFRPGQWWLNLHCAFRDGIVGRADGRKTISKYGVTALPLLSGEENVGPKPNQIQYTKRGRSRDMPFTLLASFGTPIRLLRGCFLKSRYAPKAGIRYDGLYLIKQYGHELVDETKNIFQCKITLERVGGQCTDLAEVLLVPSPSEIDDWNNHIRAVGEHIRRIRGDVIYSEWMTNMDNWRAEKDAWLRQEGFVKIGRI